VHDASVGKVLPSPVPLLSFSTVHVLPFALSALALQHTSLPVLKFAADTC
jgi:hypothetical protein